MPLATTVLLAVALASPGSRPAPAGGPDEAPLFVRSWGCEGPYEPFFGTCWAPDGPGVFSWPSGAAVAPDGSVYVIDRVEGVVERYSADGVFLDSWPADPQAIAVGSDGSVWLARDGGWARKYAPDGTLLVELSLPPGEGLFRPYLVDVGPDGDVYVADLGSFRVFDPDGNFLRTVGSFLPFQPVALTIGARGDLFVTSQHLKRFALDGTLLQEWPGRKPVALDLSDDGLLFESFRDRIEVSRMGTQPLFQWAVPGTQPRAVDVDVTGDVVWVTESFDGRLQKWGWGTVVETDPPGLDFLVDEVPYRHATLFDWPAGEEHRVSAVSPQPDGPVTRHDYLAWTDGGARRHTVIATGGNARITARFRTSHWMEMAAAPGIRVRPASGWVTEGQVVPIEAAPDDPFESIAWTGTGDGSYTGPGRTETVTVREPITQFAARGTSPEILFDFTISASDADPFVNTDAPAAGPRPLYLWATCALDGLAAFETGVGGTLSRGPFVPLGGVLNAASNGDLLLAVPSCPTGPFTNRLLGYWLVNDTGGTLCLAPSAAGNRVVAVECAAATGSHDPGIRGFSSAGGAPCEIGAGCYLGQVDRSGEIASSAATATAAGVRLAAPGPNPFGSSTSLALSLPDPRAVSVAVYDVAGRRVRELQSGVLPAGRHVFTWDGVSSGGELAADGVYFVRMRAGDEVRTRKVVLSRTR